MNQTKFKHTVGGLPVTIVRRVLDHFGVKKAVVVGRDWGGGVAIEFALRKPPTQTTFALRG